MYSLSRGGASVQIENEFVVQAPVGEVWDYLLRTEDVVECIPGAQILEKLSDDEYRGRVTVKLGPLAVNLEGVVTIDERDPAAMALAISGKAKDTKGRGSTDAKVTVNVGRSGGDAARVTLVSDIKITGKIAQFGRGVMKDVTQRIAEEFARNLEARIVADPVAVESGHQVIEGEDVSPERAAATAATAAPSVSAAAPGHRAAAPQASNGAAAVGGIGLMLGAIARSLGRGIGALAGRLWDRVKTRVGGRR
jgi:carbon monoxide dehydrogenase subunit G